MPAPSRFYTLAKAIVKASVRSENAKLLDVWYPTSSGCDYVSEFVSDNSRGKTIRIKAYGTTSNSVCTMAATPKIIQYEFTPLEKGKYILIFISKNETEIEHSLTIN